MKVEMKAYVLRGKNAGLELAPHRHADGLYVASMTRFSKDYLRVASVEALADLLDQGYRIRMSLVDKKRAHAPTLIAACSIVVRRA